MWRLTLCFVIAALSLSAKAANAEEKGKAEITWFGNNSMKIRTAEGTVIYVDPFADGDYSQPADIIIATHEHHDHNKIELCTQKPDCLILRAANMISISGKAISYNSFDRAGVHIEPVAAANKNHAIESCVGLLISFDDFTIYVAGDTSKLAFMADLKAKHIDYTFLPTDGQYNMGMKEAMECAEMIGAAHNIPVHNIDVPLSNFSGPNALILEPGQTIYLEK